jgi:purine-binding chemotaxis protein CheW
VDTDSIEPAASSGVNTDLVEGVAKYDGRLIILLKIEELMKSEVNDADAED